MKTYMFAKRMTISLTQIIYKKNNLYLMHLSDVDSLRHQ